VDGSGWKAGGHVQVSSVMCSSVMFKSHVHQGKREKGGRILHDAAIGAIQASLDAGRGSECHCYRYQMGKGSKSLTMYV
jgi:hypothetical protein